MDQELLYQKLQNYCAKDIYPFHMPGHKRREIPFDQSYSIDITEIDGFDDLHHPQGILKQGMEQTAKRYGADSSYYLVNGSTCGILTAISAVTNVGDEILAARNSHKSVFNGIFLRQLKPHYIYPQVLDKLWINGGISPQDVEKQLVKYPNIHAIILTSPTYEGIVSDIRKISEIVHSFNVPLIVDEAHGAHFSYGNQFPQSALDCGADVVIQSLHKTLPCLTQTAVLHLRHQFVQKDKIEQYLQIYQSSSPSYVLMASIDACLHQMEETGDEMIFRFYERLERFYKRTEQFRHIWQLSPSVVGKAAIFAFDQSKLVFGARNHKWTGDRFAQVLRRQYQLEMEMCTPGYVLGMTSVMDTEEGMGRLADALEKIEGSLERESGIASELEQLDSDVRIKEDYIGIQRQEERKVILTPYEASLSCSEWVPFSKAVGRICKEMLYIYPPGIPFLMPGERVCQKDVELLGYYQNHGVLVKGGKKVPFGYLSVI